MLIIITYQSYHSLAPSKIGASNNDFQTHNIFIKIVSFNIWRVEYFAHWVVIMLNCNYSYKKIWSKALVLDNAIYATTVFNMFE